MYPTVCNSNLWILLQESGESDSSLEWIVDDDPPFQQACPLTTQDLFLYYHKRVKKAR